MIYQRFKCLLVDDEPLAIEELASFVQAHPELEFIGATTDPLEVEDLINRYRPDILFADLHMSGMHGIDLIHLLQHQVEIVCCTAHNHYAAETFELDVAFYLLKPLSQKRFDQAIEKVKKSIRAKNLF